MTKSFSNSILFVFWWIVLGITPSFAASNVLFILDGSGSMWGRIDGKPKIEVAKTVLEDVIKGLPESSKTGFMVYGHRSKNDCEDVELMIPVVGNSVDFIVKDLAAVQPKGKTPISFALEKSRMVFKPLKGQDNAVVLVSDGEETCGKDLCQVASELAAEGIGLKIHVVGFDVSENESRQLKCIADKGNGLYFSARNAQGLEDALAQVKKEVLQPAPAPEKEILFDDFDGEYLKDHWEVIHPNPDAYIVEDSGLLVIASGNAGFKSDRIENIFQLTTPLPKEDWVITGKIRVDFQTKKERPFMALYQDKDNVVYISLWESEWSAAGEKAKIGLSFTKISKGKATQFTEKIWMKKSDDPNLHFSDAAKEMPQPLILRLQKKGRRYLAAAMLENAEKPEWVEVEAFTLLRQKGNLAIGFFQDEDAKGSGESTVVFDSIRITAQKTENNN